MSNNNLLRHWPTALLGTLVAVILLIAVFSYQVAETELVVVTTLGKVEDYQPEPGLHFRWPYPIQEIHRFDGRDQTFGGQIGAIEETNLSGHENILVGVYVIYRISDVQKFFAAYKTTAEAEAALDVWMSGAKKNIFTQYGSAQIFNSNSANIKLDEILEKIKNELDIACAGRGIQIKMVGLHSLNIPQGVTQTVFQRMAAERDAEAQKAVSQGAQQAEMIRIRANSFRNQKLAEAQAMAREIQAEGDAEAAAYYKTFEENPELAEFLHKLQALREITSNKTTLILDDNTSPFDLLKPSAIQDVKTLPAQQ